MSRSFINLIVVLFKGYWREPGVLFWTLGFPVGVAWVLGVSFLEPPAVSYNVVVSQSAEGGSLVFQGSPTSLDKEVVVEFRAAEGGQVEKVRLLPSGREEAVAALKRGEALLHVEIMGGGSSSHAPLSVRYFFDPANPEAKVAYLWVRGWLRDRALQRGGKSSPLVESVEAFEVKGSRYIDFLIPGLIALGIMNSSLWGIGWTLIEYRIKKFLRRMIATPLSKWEFMAALSTTRVCLGLIEAGLLLTFARFLFGVRIASGGLLFLVVFLAGSVSFMGIAVLAGSRTSNTRVGNGIINAISMPMFILSGVFFSYENLPEWLVGFVKFLPLSILADTLRAVMLSEVGFSDVLAPCLLLVAIGLVFYSIGIRVYRWY